MRHAVVAMLLVLQEQHAAIVHGDTGTVDVTLHNGRHGHRLRWHQRAHHAALRQRAPALRRHARAAARDIRKPGVRFVGSEPEGTFLGVFPSAYALDVPRGTSASRVNPIVFEFVVDTSSHVEQQTFHVVSTADRSQVEAISQQLRDSPYRPALRQGHKVRQLLRITVYAVRH